MVGAAGGGGAVLFMCEQSAVTAHRTPAGGPCPRPSKRGGFPFQCRARGGVFPFNSCLLYFSSIDYINRPADRPYLARDSYLLKTLNKLTDNLPR
jgi:hypothetical protein